MPWITCHHSDIGGREEQQDRFATFSSQDGNCQLLIVADGAGGHNDGAAAAQIVIDLAAEQQSALLTSTKPEHDLLQFAHQAHAQVKSLAAGSEGFAATTLAMLLTQQNNAYWLHVGDSRIYHLRNGQIVNKTTDHSLVELKRSHPEAVPQKVGSNALYMCLGGPSAIAPSVDMGIVQANDCFVICSDGLWGQTALEQLFLNSQKPLDTIQLQDWVTQARQNGGIKSDNITAIVATWTQAETKQSIFKRLLLWIKTLFN